MPVCYPEWGDLFLPDRQNRRRKSTQGTLYTGWLSIPVDEWKQLSPKDAWKFVLEIAKIRAMFLLVGPHGAFEVFEGNELPYIQCFCYLKYSNLMALVANTCPSLPKIITVILAITTQRSIQEHFSQNWTNQWLRSVSWQSVNDP